MDQGNQENTSGAPSNFPVKRKRGRPKRDPSEKHANNIQAPLPPGFAGVNGSQSHQLEPIDNTNNNLVGQPVCGVVEAVFDAGYLLNVKINNSDMILRGVVFKPGHFDPISSENDIAPHVQMVQRHEIPLPKTHKRVHGNRGKKYRKRNGQQLSIYNGNGASHSLNESSPALPIQVASPLSSRGKFVPVILQPVIGASPAPHLLNSKFKHGPLLSIKAAPLSNAPPPANQAPQQNRTTHKAASTGMQNKGNPASLSETPFRALLEEVIRTSEEQHKVMNINGYGNLSTGDTGFNLETEGTDMNEPLFIEPLRSFQPDPHERSISIPGTERVGKMTQLLHVVQENSREKQLPKLKVPKTEGCNEMRVPEY